MGKWTIPKVDGPEAQRFWKSLVMKEDRPEKKWLVSRVQFPKVDGLGLASVESECSWERLVSEVNDFENGRSQDWTISNGWFWAIIDGQRLRNGAQPVKWAVFYGDDFTFVPGTKCIKICCLIIVLWILVDLPIIGTLGSKQLPRQSWWYMHHCIHAYILK